MDRPVVWEIEETLKQIEVLYPKLHRLEARLKELGVDLGQPLPKNGTLNSLTDYGHALIGLAKFIEAIGRGIIRLGGGDDE